MKVDEYDLKLYNPNLSGGTYDVPTTKRIAFNEVLSATERSGITAVVGLRRVGKTVLLKQVLNSLGERRSDIFYFSFDEERYSNQEGLESVIRSALELYDAPLIALDEISRIKGWSGIVKKYHDSKGIRFLLSGSASLEITKGKESLAGRLFDIYLPPLQYLEFVSFINNMDPEPGPVMDLKEPNRTFIQWEDRGYLDDFLTRGGFPELVDIRDNDFIRKYILSSTVEKIVYEDLPKSFGISDENALFRIWELVSTNPSMTFIPSNLEDTIGVSRDTISKYLFYLERAYLVKTVLKSSSVTSRLRKGKKVYPPTPCIALQIGRDDTSMGAVAETAVLDKLSNGFGLEVGFFSGRGRSEVDFITTDFPVEVKYRSSISPSDHHNLIKYMTAKNIDTGIMVTRSEKGVFRSGDKRIVMIPMELFLQLDRIIS